MTVKDTAPLVNYLSSGANRQTAVADWNRDGVLAFGADINVALWSPKSSKGVSALLTSHSEQVKAVKFLPQEVADSATYLLSGADDKALVIWKSDSPGDGFSSIHACKEHAAPINCIEALRTKDETPTWRVATGAADATIRIWKFSSDALQLLQTIKSKPKFFPLALSLSYLDDQCDVAILAAAGTKTAVQIFTAESSAEAADFKLQATLTGHEGWIRSLSCIKETAAPDSDILIASASQDKYVRIWRVHKGTELPSLSAAGPDPSSDAYMPGKSPSNKAHRLNVANKDFSITFEALLLGHEDWIYSARWYRHADNKLQLLSTSADNSLAIWEADPSSGIWISMVRLGEISREKGATTATGSTGGFWTGLWSPDGKSVACLGRTGSWRRWEHDEVADSWRPCFAVSGHTKAVTGISWSKNGDYLLSSSSDQTTRLHTQWKASELGSWHEMSRPQIHGYDLNCIDSLGSSQFVSGADEKLMRVFDEPKAVAAMLGRLAGIENVNVDDRPDAANMPVLGLSNKAVDAVDDDAEQQQVDDRDREAMDPASIVRRSHLDIDHPPYEETLSRHTLWPETEKLYGHGYEISCLATSHDGTLVASACKASSANHGVIRLFETSQWTEIRPPLTAHSLTATRLRFSPDDKFLLSVGRDRQWAVFERQPDDPQQYQLLQSNPKGHSRMMLDAAWLASTTPMFATAGRDKQVKVWTGSKSAEGKWQFVQTAVLPCPVPVTAVDGLQHLVGGRSIFAVGLESGRLRLCSISTDGSDVGESPLSQEANLSKTVLQLAWRPLGERKDADEYQLACAGEDSTLRIYTFSSSSLVS